jgi:PHD/YefM family antitoxin component YafN of YafNO toxin-antitoxin module
MAWSSGIPFVDPAIEHVGVSKLRTLNATNLGRVKKLMVIQDNDAPLAVLLSYQQYLTIQNKLQEALDAVELLSKKENVDRLLASLRDFSECRVTPLVQGTKRELAVK